MTEQAAIWDKHSPAHYDEDDDGEHVYWDDGNGQQVDVFPGDKFKRMYLANTSSGTG